MSADLILTVPEAELESEVTDLTPNAATPYARFLVRTALVRTPGEMARKRILSPAFAKQLAEGFTAMPGGIGQVFCVTLGTRTEVTAIRTQEAARRPDGYVPSRLLPVFLAETLLMASAGACLVIVPQEQPLRESSFDDYSAMAVHLQPCVGEMVDLLFCDGRTTYSSSQPGIV